MSVKKLLYAALDRAHSSLFATEFWLKEAGTAAKGNAKATANITGLQATVKDLIVKATKLRNQALEFKADPKPRARTTKAKRKVKKAKRTKRAVSVHTSVPQTKAS